MIQIFNLILAGKDQEEYCHKSKAAKKEWILANTTVTDETVVDAFVARPLRHMDGKLCCSGHKTISHAKNNQPASDAIVKKKVNANEQRKTTSPKNTGDKPK